MSPEITNARGPAQRDRHEAALTPFPRRLLLVGRVRPGAEAAVREAQAHFPADAAARVGIGAVEAFIGSGYYAMTLEVDDDDVQTVLSAWFNDPAVREFHTSLQPMTEGLPGDDWRFSTWEGLHADPLEPASGSPSSGPVYGSADLPLAASMYRWRAGETPQTGVEPEGGGGLRPGPLRQAASAMANPQRGPVPKIPGTKNRNDYTQR